MHQIRSLTWARPAPTAPWPKPRGQRGTKALGLRYERLCAKALPHAEHGGWWEFQDGAHHGFCSPDLLLLIPRLGVAVVLECKLQNWREAWDQLDLLYLPVLTMALQMRVMGVVIVRHVSPGVTIAHSLREALLRQTERPVLHWLGHGPFPLESTASPSSRPPT